MLAGILVIGEEGVAVREGDALQDRLALDVARGQALLERGPEEETALGLTEREIRLAVLVERGRQGIELLRVDLAHVLDVLVQAAVRHEVVDHMVQQRAVAHLEAHPHHALDDGRLGVDPADAETGRDDLREGADRDQTLHSGQLGERGGAVLGVDELAVGVVIENQRTVVRGETEQLVSPLERHRRADRVVEVADRVDQLRALALRFELGEDAGELVGVEAVLVHADGEDVRLAATKGAERPGERGRLGDDGVAGAEECRTNEVDRAGAAVGEQKVVGGHRHVAVACVSLGKRLAEGLVAGAAAVAQRAVVGYVEGRDPSRRAALRGAACRDRECRRRG